MVDFSNQIDSVVEVARVAGQRILSVCQDGFEVTKKSDNSPVTEADMASHHAIQDGLSRFSDYPILSEEAARVDFETRRQWSQYWLIDPLDGTRDFIRGHDSYSINIALIDNHQVALGVVYIPAQERMYFAAKGSGAFCEQGGQRTRLKVKTFDHDQSAMRIAVSRSHPSEALQVFLNELGNYESIALGSALKMCMVAEGEVDFYPRLGPTWEWDTAAAQCVVEEAGGQLTDMEFKSFQYNAKENLVNPPFFAMGNIQNAGLERIQHALAVTRQQLKF